MFAVGVWRSSGEEGRAGDRCRERRNKAEETPSLPSDQLQMNISRGLLTRGDSGPRSTREREGTTRNESTSRIFPFVSCPATCPGIPVAEGYDGLVPKRKGKRPVG